MSAIDQWGRRARVTLDDGTSGVLVADHYPDRSDGLHVSVEVDMNTTLAPQPCRLEVWNLSAERRARLSAVQDLALETAWATRKARRIGRLRIEAGRLGAFGVCFAGIIMEIRHDPDGADWKTTITAQDGRIEWANARVAETIAPGVELADYEATLRASEQVLLGGEPFEAFVGQFQGIAQAKALKGYEQGFALLGNSIQHNQLLCEALGLEAFWHLGRFIYVPRGRATTDPAIAYVRGSTLLAEGAPTRGFRTSRTLLDARALPGRQVQLFDEGGDPIGARAYRIDAIKRRFSTWDRIWEDAISLRPTTPIPLPTLPSP